eukprot:GHVP01039696.1.p1 GENE.GHVP01039696.1~~GHVP01039696.1.p1  ORF type:complete len:474 (-),score=89.46 GHVP01039696.1:595-1851(-)
MKLRDWLVSNFPKDEKSEKVDFWLSLHCEELLKNFSGGFSVSGLWVLGNLEDLFEFCTERTLIHIWDSNPNLQKLSLLEISENQKSMVKPQHLWSLILQGPSKSWSENLTTEVMVIPTVEEFVKPEFVLCSCPINTKLLIRCDPKSNEKGQFVEKLKGILKKNYSSVEEDASFCVIVRKPGFAKSDEDSIIFSKRKIPKYISSNRNPDVALLETMTLSDLIVDLNNLKSCSKKDMDWLEFGQTPLTSTGITIVVEIHNTKEAQAVAQIECDYMSVAYALPSDTVHYVLESFYEYASRIVATYTVNEILDKLQDDVSTRARNTIGNVCPLQLPPIHFFQCQKPALSFAFTSNKDTEPAAITGIPANHWELLENLDSNTSRKRKKIYQESIKIFEEVDEDEVKLTDFEVEINKCFLFSRW